MIVSRANPAVRLVRDQSRERSEGRFLLEGPHLLEEALSADVPLELVLYSARALRGGGALVERLRARAAQVLEVSDEIVEYAADSQHPQGLLAIGRIPAAAVEEERLRGGQAVLLDGVSDPGNLGTIARTAWAAGAAAVVLAGPTVDPWSPKVVRAAAGALFRLPILSFRERSAAADYLIERGQRLVMATARGGASCLDADLRPPITFVLGHEAHGVHPDLAQRCDGVVHIPMVKECESLNLAAAAAVLLYLALDRSRAPR